MFADRQNQELDREQVAVHRDLDVANVLLKEVERQLVFEWPYKSERSPQDVTP